MPHQPSVVHGTGLSASWSHKVSLDSWPMAHFNGKRGLVGRCSRQAKAIGEFHVRIPSVGVGLCLIFADCKARSVEPKAGTFEH
jgi:hypothetical protein